MRRSLSRITFGGRTRRLGSSPSGAVGLQAVITASIDGTTTSQLNFDSFASTGSITSTTWELISTLSDIVSGDLGLPLTDPSGSVDLQGSAGFPMICMAGIKLTVSDGVNTSTDAVYFRYLSLSIVDGSLTHTKPPDGPTYTVVSGSLDDESLTGHIDAVPTSGKARVGAIEDGDGAGSVMSPSIADISNVTTASLPGNDDTGLMYAFALGVNSGNDLIATTLCGPLFTFTVPDQADPPTAVGGVGQATVTFTIPNGATKANIYDQDDNLLVANLTASPHAVSLGTGTWQFGVRGVSAENVLGIVSDLSDPVVVV